MFEFQLDSQEKMCPAEVPEYGVKGDRGGLELK